MLENQLSQDDLKDMSPEQIMELQKQQCIFCKIIKGEIPAKKVYEDDICVAILDINPANPGHVLLLPKEHFTIMPQIPEEVIEHLAIISKQLSGAALKSFGAQGTNIFIANGAIAGQRAPHFMIHIIPRKEGDKVEGFSIPENKISDKDSEQIQKIIKAKLGGEVVEEKAEEKEEVKEEPKKEKKKAPKKKEEDVDINTIAKMFQ
ncbi:HIT family protein [Nanoarchaeota archaeon]